jgi:hypothetical protein
LTILERRKAVGKLAGGSEAVRWPAKQARLLLLLLRRRRV